jgi:hypothetical protein
MILDDGAGNRLAVRIRWPDGRSPDDPVEEGDWLWVGVDAATPHAGWQVSDVECLEAEGNYRAVRISPFTVTAAASAAKQPLITRMVAVDPIVCRPIPASACPTGRLP